MRLNHVNDKILVLDLKKLVHEERSSTSSILFHLLEVERRKIFSELKFTSMFDYCVRELGYSEGAAQRRIVAARLLKDMPEIGPKVESGELSLTNISLVNRFFKSKEEKREAFVHIEGMSKKQAEKKLFEMTGRVLDPPPSKTRMSTDTTQIAIVLKDETLALMDKAQSLSGKTDMDDLIQFAMKLVIERVEKTKFKQTVRPKSPPPAAAKSRYVSAYVKREIYKKDQVCVKCGSIHNLQYDHRKAYAVGGTSGIENIRMLCFHCNQRERMNMRL